MAIGERITLRLQHLGFSQSELARRAGLPQSTINTLINRDTRSSPHTMKLAAALRTTPAYLLGETEDPESETADESISVEERELIGLTRSLSKQDFGAVTQLLRSLARGATASDYSSEKDPRTGMLHDRQLGFTPKEEGKAWR